MLDDANQVETTETTAEVPASQPDQGGDTPAAAQVTEQVSAPQGQSAQQQPPMIPKWRFDQVNEQLKLERQRGQSQQPAPQVAPTAPPKEEQFETWQEFQDARAAYIADQRFEQRMQQQQQAAQQQAAQTRAQTVESNWVQKSDEASAKYPDFEQKISTCPPLIPHALQVVKGSLAAGDLAYHLASNPDLIGRLNGMHPLDAAAELGRIEAKLQGSSGQPKSKPSAGIPVITPVGAGQKHGTVDPYAAETSVEDYIRATRPPPRRK